MCVLNKNYHPVTSIVYEIVLKTLAFKVCPKRLNVSCTEKDTLEIN